jgi:tRNA-2-methylthio-N6-dimethylallyladenosine synthase
MKGLYIQTFGCQMNVSDSDRMKATLHPLGYQEVKTPEEAEIVLINTCSIREKAEEKMSSTALELKKLKDQKPGMIIGITGCVAQQEKDSIQKKLPFVDVVLGPDNIDDLPWAIESLQSHESLRVQKTEFDREARLWSTKTQLLNPGPSAFVSVMKGCDHFCSYCIVPHVRGREKSRPIADVLEDVKELVARGVKEITYLGQNINTYGKRAEESLHELFRRTHDIPGLERIRFTTSHPGDLKDELIRCFEELPKLCSYFHLPVQSGSTTILRSMRRFYTREQYLERVRALRQARADIAFSTDFIVGFPGETEEDFELSMSLAREVRYDNVYSFLFSPRPGTAAAERTDTTTVEVKLARLMKLQELCRKISKELHQSFEGKVVEVLIEGPSKKDATRMSGRNSQNVLVHLTPEDSLQVQPGQIVAVEIHEGTQTYLTGRLLRPAIQSAAPRVMSSLNLT